MTEFVWSAFIFYGTKLTREKSEQAQGKERFIVVSQEEDSIINSFLLGEIVMAINSLRSSVCCPSN